MDEMKKSYCIKKMEDFSPWQRFFLIMRVISKNLSNSFLCGLLITLFLYKIKVFSVYPAAFLLEAFLIMSFFWIISSTICRFLFKEKVITMYFYNVIILISRK